MNFELINWIDKNLPKEKKEFSRDAVEILMGILWKEAKKSERAEAKEREREEKHGPMWI